MAWPSDFYRKRKNPWIGFVLVLLVAPFGFLYSSWKTALLVLFVIGPLWIMFLRNTRFDLIENPWAHYIALLLLAGFSALQINGQNIRIANEAAEAKVLEAVLSMLPSDVERQAFAEHLAANGKLAEKLRKNDEILSDPQAPFSRWQIALLLSSYSTAQGQAGNLQGASSSLLFSLMFFEDNPSAWAGMAEVYTAWQDKVGARWANKVLNFEPKDTHSEIINSLYLDPATLSAMEEMKVHMKALIRVCSQHPEWRDSYALKKLYGVIAICRTTRERILQDTKSELKP